MKVRVNTRYQLLILLLLAAGLNFNTLFNQFALDDGTVITANAFVKKGFSGIPDILTNDLMKGYTDKEVLNQARYRPVSLIVFAIEYQLAGESPAFFHFVQLLLFLLLIFLLFKLLNDHLFQDDNNYISFLSCLLFVIHPVHTEVIANIKSGDELIAFILILISLLNAIKYFTLSKIKYLVFSLLYFFLAIFTRESAITFIAVVPLVMFFFYDFSPRKAVWTSVPFAVVFFIAMIIRMSITGISQPIATDVLNSPFLLASPVQAFATKVFIILKYVGILFYPFSLSFDYGYRQIPYVNFTSVEFIFSALILSALALTAIYLLKRRSLISFCIFYFFITISLASNIILDIGTPFSERLDFQPSLAFCIFIAFVLITLNKKIKYVSPVILIVACILFSVKIIARNSEWKNNNTLFLTDVNSCPNSARINWGVCEIYRFNAENEIEESKRKEFLENAIKYGRRAIVIHPGFAAAYISLGFPYYYSYQYDEAAALWLKGYSLDTTSAEAKKCLEVLSEVFSNHGNELMKNGDFSSAMKMYEKAKELNANNTDALKNLSK